MRAASLRGRNPGPPSRLKHSCRWDASPRSRCSLLLVLLAPAAQAADRRVPRGWLGVVADGPLTHQGAALDGEWDLMATSGAESVRTAFYWPPVQPEASVPPDLSRFDAIVLSAARRNLQVLPIVTGTPGWAGRNPGDETSPPRDPKLYADFLRTLVARYGPSGSLWTEHPEVPERPIRDWQIWNEPNLTRYWTPPRGQGFARSYVRLLRAAHKALEGADPRLAHDPRRAPERELDGAASDLQGAAGSARSTPWRCIRTRASRATWCGSPSSPGARCAASATRASRSGSPSSRGRRRRARRATRSASRPPTAARRRG